MEREVRRRLCFLGVALCCLLQGLVLYEGQRLEQAAAALQGETVVRGARLYDEHCRKCHGARGEGLGQLGPALADRHFFTGRMAEVGWLLDLEQYVTASTAGGRLMATRPLYAGNGKTAVMPPWALAQGGPLRDDEIAAIARFVMNWQDTALGRISLPLVELPRPDLADPATIKAGSEVFAQHCLSCHALNGLPGGGHGGPSLDRIAATAGERLPPLPASEYIRQSVLVPAAFVVEGYGEQANDRGCGALFSERQLEAVVAFLVRQN